MLDNAGQQCPQPVEWSHKRHGSCNNTQRLTKTQYLRKGVNTTKPLTTAAGSSCNCHIRLHTSLSTSTPICVQSFYPNTCHALRSDSTAKPSYQCRCTGPSTFHPSSDCLVTCACARPLTADCAVRAGHCSTSRTGGQNWTRLFKTLLLYIMQESMNNMTPNNTPHNTHSRTPQQPHISSYVNPWKVCQSKNRLLTDFHVRRRQKAERQQAGQQGPLAPPTASDPHPRLATPEGQCTCQTDRTIAARQPTCVPDRLWRILRAHQTQHTHGCANPWKLVWGGDMLPAT